MHFRLRVVETIIQVVCGANGRLFPTRRDSYHTQMLRITLFFISPKIVQAHYCRNKKNNLKIHFRLRVVETIRLELMTSTMST